MISKEFTIPKSFKAEGGPDGKAARIVVEPFERGYGTTVGNSLRRVLLASLEGSAVTAIRFEDIHHEFSAIPGVLEDVTDVVLNLKNCHIRLNEKESHIFTFIWGGGEGPVTAASLFAGQDIDVFNPEHVVFNCTRKDARIQMEIKVAKGRGYVTADQFELEHAPLGTVYMDAGFSPVVKVNFQVEDARVGQMTDYDRLIMEIVTNGAITPEEALTAAAQLLIDHFSIFTPKEPDEAAGGLGIPEDPELVKLLMRPIAEVELSVRAANCLKAANIATLGQLVARKEAELLQYHNFGKQSLKEIEAKIEELGLALGMEVGALGEIGPVTEGGPDAASAPSDEEDYEDTDEIDDDEE